MGGEKRHCALYRPNVGNACAPKLNYVLIEMNNFYHKFHEYEAICFGVARARVADMCAYYLWRKAHRPCQASNALLDYYDVDLSAEIFHIKHCGHMQLGLLFGISPALGCRL